MSPAVTRFSCSSFPWRGGLAIFFFFLGARPQTPIAPLSGRGNATDQLFLPPPSIDVDCLEVKACPQHTNPLTSF
ncbi:hypothetical protein K491DRAFT_697551 [Lophiostoma macrostomum CBS 122681]|uniref:Secreted protein n=1 Tax=Lophiostoma macrostomum CBS 122681 TaxID=1314788 RepID=A0A6A6SVC1_9PLEO|nr:hypothetical protein K491DRAFT_697551 [Lophiostoma macrostomum CBS 122681]